MVRQLVIAVAASGAFEKCSSSHGPVYRANDGTLRSDLVEMHRDLQVLLL